MQPKTELQFLIDRHFPLIKCYFKDKRPCEQWRKGEHRERPASFYRGSNVAVKCGTEFEGEYLNVLDVDPRNSGLISLEKIEKKYGDLPSTLTVNTGSGGKHFYFVTPYPIKKMKLEKGLDWQGEGSYVVAPPSVHPNGKPYQFENVDEVVERAPQWLLDLLAIPDDVYFNAYDHESLNPQVFQEGERDELMTREAGKMRRIGLDEEQLFLALQITNKKKCQPPLSESQIRKIAKSVAKYAPDAEEIQEAAPLMVESNPKDDLKPIIVDDYGQEQLRKCYEKTTGNFRKIIDSVLDSSPRQYPNFGIASGLAVVSVAVQGTFECPSLTREGESAGPLSLYQWVAGPAACGKDSYLKGVESWSRALDDRLRGGKLGSYYGLRAELFGFNSRIQIIDEFQDEMRRLTSNPGNYLSQIVTEMKEVTTAQILTEVTIKDRTYPEIKNPHLSVFTAGTLEGLCGLMNGEMIGGGLFSRFAISIVAEAKKSNPDLIRKIKIDPDVLAHLKTLFNKGLTYEAHEQDAKKEMERFFEISAPLKAGKKTKERIIHIPQMVPEGVVGIEADARQIMQEFCDIQEERYLEYTRTNMAGTDLSPGSITDRSRILCVKVAALYSLANGHTSIKREHAEWACEYTDALVSATVTLMQQHAAVTVFDKKNNRIVEIIKRSCSGENLPSMRDIMRLAHLAKREVEPMVMDLCESGRIVALNKDGKVVDFSGMSKRAIPRGTRFRMPTES